MPNFAAFSPFKCSAKFNAKIVPQAFFHKLAIKELAMD
jgi:hypothetical protein